MDYSQILPQLILGSCPESVEDINVLKLELAVTAVLNLQTDEDMEHLELNWNALSRHYTLSRIQVIRVPITDFDHVDLRDKLPWAIRTLDRLLKIGKNRVYVHCTAGASRAPTVVVAYLHWCTGKNLKQSASKLMALRSCSPDVDAISRATESFKTLF